MNGSVRVGPNNGRWSCDKRVHSVVHLDGATYCGNCGRPVNERFRERPGRNRPEYLRTHAGLWSMYGACA